MPRFQFSLRSALLFMALIAVALAPLRLVPHRWLPGVYAAACMFVGYGCLLRGAIRDNNTLLLIDLVLAGVVLVFFALACAQRIGPMFE